MVAFVQGAAVGAMMRGIPVVDGQFAGTAFDWVHPFPILTGLGMVFGYALLGASWIVLKGEGAIRDWAYVRIPRLAATVFIVLGLAFIVAVTIDAGAVAQSNLHRLGPDLPAHWLRRAARHHFRGAGAARCPTLRVDDSFLYRLLPDARRHVLAVHDSVFGDRCQCRSAGCSHSNSSCTAVSLYCP